MRPHETIARRARLQLLRRRLSYAPFTALFAVALGACSSAVPEHTSVSASELQAEGLSTAGACPAFHCGPEANGAMSLPLGASAYSIYWQNSGGAR